MKNTTIFLLSTLFILCSYPLFAGTDTPATSTALQGVKDAKVYFDVTMGDPKKLLIRLELIETTYRQLTESGVQANVVVGFRGKASNFVTKADHYVLEEDLPIKKQIAALIKSFHSQGFLLEQCRIAAGFEGIDPVDFLPSLKVVANGYISLIGYQSKGYALVPMD